jgi:hypothetical protein
MAGSVVERKFSGQPVAGGTPARKRGQDQTGIHVTNRRPAASVRNHLLTPQYVRRALLTGFVAVYYGVFCWWPELMGPFGVDRLGFWFLDMHALLAASDAHALGLDPYRHNPFDHYQQPHVYSDWWFGLHSLGLSRVDHVWLGALLGLVFLGVAVLQVRVRTNREMLFSAAALTAPSVLLGFNRGNADLLIFIMLAATVPCLLSAHRAVRWLALATVLIATGLKFYPVVGAVVLLFPTRSRREILWQVFAFSALLALLVFDQAENLRHYAAGNTRPEGFFTFGAAISAQLFAAPGWITTAIAVPLGIGVVVFWWRNAPKLTIAEEDRADYLRFILGAVLLTACYFVTINYAYRRVFAIFMVPFLWTAWHATDWPIWFRRLGRINGILLVTLMWLDGLICLGINLVLPLRPGELLVWTDWLMLVQQPLVAVVRIVLLGFLVAFVRDALRDLWPRNRVASA